MPLPAARPAAVLAALAAGVACAAGGAAAQSTAPRSGLDPRLLDAPAGAPDAALPTADYLARVGGGEQYAIQSGEIASSLAASPALRALGRDMVAAYRADALRLARAATGVSGPAYAPPALTADQQAQLDQLRDLRGAAFDRAYLDQQLSLHEEASRLHAAYVRGGSDSDLRRFAATAATAERARLRRVEALDRRVRPTSPPRP